MEATLSESQAGRAQDPLKSLSIKVNFEEGEPRHLCHITIGEKRVADCVVVKDLLDPEAKRSIILIGEKRLPKKLLKEHQPFIDSIRAELAERKQRYKVGDVSAHKSLAIDIVESEVTNLRRVQVCNYKFGAVACHLLSTDTSGRFKICIIPSMNEAEKDLDKVNGLSFRLKSYLEIDLTDMLSQHIEDAVYYLESIFRASSHEVVIRYCRKIREILGEGFDSKIDDIFKRTRFSHVPKIEDKLKEIGARYWQELRTLAFCREFILLLVNYIYSSLNFTARLPDYRARLDKMLSEEKDCEIPEQYRVLINAYQRLERDDDIKIPETGRYDSWLRMLLWAARKVQYVRKVRADLGERIGFSKVNIFLSHHMSVPNSLYFSCCLQRFVQDQSLSHVNIVLGSTTDQEMIDDSVEALIWLSDALLIYIPSVCCDFTGKPVTVHEWIIRETLCGKMLDKPFCFVFEMPSSFDLAGFFNQLRTFEQEHSETDEEGVPLHDSFRNKLKKCIRELPSDMQMKYRIEYTPSCKFDQKIAHEIKRKIRDFSVHKCLTTLKMIRLWFKRRTWYPIIHIHRLSKRGALGNSEIPYIMMDSVIEAIREDRYAPYKNKSKPHLHRLLNKTMKKYERPIVVFDGKYCPLVETNGNGEVRSNLHRIMLSMQNKYNIEIDLTPTFDSQIERSDVMR